MSHCGPCYCRFAFIGDVLESDFSKIIQNNKSTPRKERSGNFGPDEESPKFRREPLSSTNGFPSGGKEA